MTKISILDCKTNMFLTLFILGLYYEVLNIHYPTKWKWKSWSLEKTKDLGIFSENFLVIIIMSCVFIRILDLIYTGLVTTVQVL